METSVLQYIQYVSCVTFSQLQYRSCRVSSITVQCVSCRVAFSRLQSCRVYSIITVRGMSRLFDNFDYTLQCVCHVYSITVCIMSRLFDYSACCVAFSRLLQYVSMSRLVDYSMCHVAFVQLQCVPCCV
jgi:hypothetical protein